MLEGDGAGGIHVPRGRGPARHPARRLAAGKLRSLLLPPAPALRGLLPRLQDPLFASDLSPGLTHLPSPAEATKAGPAPKFPASSAKKRAAVQADAENPRPTPGKGGVLTEKPAAATAVPAAAAASTAAGAAAAAAGAVAAAALEAGS